MFVHTAASDEGCLGDVFIVFVQQDWTLLHWAEAKAWDLVGRGGGGLVIMKGEKES
jgi:hypothetical protein